jgi:CopG family transcriptional regulator, nickel-responsive regulator
LSTDAPVSPDLDAPRHSAGAVTRFGVSMDSHLLSRFDDLIARQGYTNRSEALRDLVRDRLVGSRWEDRAGQVPAVVALVYDHEMRLLGDQMTAMQHEHAHLVISSMHVHLDAGNCLEVTVMQGPSAEVRGLAERLLSLRGVKHGRLVMTGSGD